MQLIGILILIGVLALLLIGVFYLGSTQKTHTPPESSLDDFYRSTGFGNVVDANKRIREMGLSGGQRRHSRGKKPHRQQGKHEGEK
ncbi:MAG TPA: hypothetical protein VGT44_18470 [Ktedonobacteraceae bacterium]|nr:hypothetical protein [Chthonomonadales bacterium]HEV2582849.1 hypothetical protein [Ktedonobacteraceae bacterium]